MKNQNKAVILGAARKKEQRDKMTQILKDGVCPFCPKYLKKYHDYPIIKVGKYWSLTKNDYPYEGSKYHYLFIYKKHVEHASEISELGFVELLNQIKWLIKKHNLRAGGFVMRFGEPTHTGASVTHLHAHLIVGGTNKEAGYLNVPIGYKSKK